LAAPAAASLLVVGTAREDRRGGLEIGGRLLMALVDLIVAVAIGGG
jgi:hypothetical protein